MSDEVVRQDLGPVLITGGHGFVGTALAERLLAAGRDVVLADVAERARPVDVPPGRSLRSVSLDVRDREAVSRAVGDAERVVHFAAVVGVDTYVEDPRRVLDVNVLGTQHVLEACLEHRRPVLMASSSEVYGTNPLPLAETSGGHMGDLHQVRWSYALSKATGEMWARALSREGLQHVVVRYFNVYGPYMDRPGEGRVISKFLGFLQRDEPLRLVDGGGAVRAFCYVDDAAEATARLVLDVEQHAGKVFNIGRDEAVSIRRLAELTLHLSGRRVGTLDVPGTRFFGDGFQEIPHRVPDLTRLHTDLGFHAEVSLEEGLRRTLAHWDLLADPSPPPAPPPRLPAVRVRIRPDDALLHRIGRTLATGHVTNHGPITQALEARLAAALGAPEVATAANGTAALLLALEACGVTEGKVALPAFTYVATRNALVRLGLEPVFVDIAPDTWTLDPDALAARVRALQTGGEGLAAIVPVTVFGVRPDLAALAAVAATAGPDGGAVPIVLDDAHGLGSTIDGATLSPHVAAHAMSMHATKLLPAVEGGLVVTRDASALERVRVLREHGLTSNRLASIPGWNARMDEVRSAVALHGLERLDAILAGRRASMATLRAALAPLDAWQLQAHPDAQVPNGQDLGVLWRGDGDVEAARAALARHGVEGRRYFWPAVHRLHDVSAALADAGVTLPVTDDIADRVLCLPLHTGMSEAEVAQVAGAVRCVAEELAP